MSSVHLAIRPARGNPNHHLWNNNGTWFVHYTVHPDRIRAERRRESLQTRSLRIARQRRDSLFATLCAKELCDVR